MGVLWVCVAACVLALTGADRGGSSLRGALEALQRRQGGRMHGPSAPDYDAVYEFIPPQGYPEPDYAVDVEDVEDEPTPRYVVQLLDQDERPPKAYEYKIIKKKKSTDSQKESAFRERTHHSDNDRLRDLFMDKNEGETGNEMILNKAENDAQYELLLEQLWSKYKNNKARNNGLMSEQGSVKKYKEKVVKKRYPNNWGPIAFKRKRSSGSETDRPKIEFESEKGNVADIGDNNYNAYQLVDDDKDDLRDEYAIAFQPLDDDNVSGLVDDEQYSYNAPEKRFAVRKRSSGPYIYGTPKKRFANIQNKSGKTKSFRSSSGTDPRIIKDLSQIFGNSDVEIVKSPVKRSSDSQSEVHDTKPPNLAMMHENHTHEHNTTKYNDNSHEQHGHNLHHPGISGKETEHVIDHSHDHHNSANDKPIIVKKKSIDWSDYFGIDKRAKKSKSLSDDVYQDKLRKQYFDTFNKEVIYPANSFRSHSYVKRNYVEPNENDDSDVQVNHNLPVATEVEKRSTNTETNTKLDDIDRNLRTMEGQIVDDALHYSETTDKLDSKEEQEMKEQLLSRLAAAYSLEKMRKALKEFKQTLKNPSVQPSPVPREESKEKRVAIKKEKAEINNNEIPSYNKANVIADFEDEQGAGHYLNGKIEHGGYSEGYMGGSGRHRTPILSPENVSGACPVLAKIVQRCRGVDMLAGDNGQLFLPLCSLHQICYLCGEAPQTTCDLVFVSEADTLCEGDMLCQRSARTALMALRELHDNLADELDGECEASPCLPATLKLNTGWQRALQ